MPATTTPAANSSRQHSISTFSANGSPTWTAGPLGRAARRSKVSLASTETPADAVAAGAGTEQDDEVAARRWRWPGGCPRAARADAERVDQRVALVAGVEDDLAADVGQAQAVAVAADPGDDAGHDPGGVGVVQGAEAQRVHHRDRPGAHRHDVADDAADAGRRALVRLDVAGVVVALDLERDGPALADVDDAGVLADADQQVLAHRVGGRLAELAQVHLAGLVGAVLAPHHRVHRQLGRRSAGGRGSRGSGRTRRPSGRARGTAGRRRGCPAAASTVSTRPAGAAGSLAAPDCTECDRRAEADTAAVEQRGSAEVNKRSPSVPGPNPASTACSGCGISPTTLPRGVADAGDVAVRAVRVAASAGSGPRPGPRPPARPGCGRRRRSRPRRSSAGRRSPRRAA